jgi:hypothetical protein
VVDGPAIVIDDDEGIVRIFSDAIVPAGRKVDGDVVAVFGKVRIDGEVAGSAVAVLGSLDIGKGASVYGDAVAVGGPLNMDATATVGGETVSVDFLPAPLRWGVPTLPILLAGIAACFAIAFLAGWILFIAAPGTMRLAASTVSQRTGGSLLLGLLAPPLVIITIGLLFITVIGIPGAFLLPMLYGILLWAGHAAASFVLGCKLTSRDTRSGAALPLAAGLGFVAAFFVAGALLATQPGVLWRIGFFLGMLGLFLMVCLSLIGSGALVLSRIGGRGERGARAASTGGVHAESGPSASSTA